MKKGKLLLGFLLLTLQPLLAQIDYSISFDTSTIKISELLSENGDSITSIEIPSLMQTEEGYIKLPFQEFNFLVPADATSFKLNITTSGNTDIDLSKSISYNPKVSDRVKDIPLYAYSSDNPHAKIVRNGYYGGEYQLVMVQVFPVIPQSNLKSLTAIQNISFTLTWSKNEDVLRNSIRSSNQSYRTKKRNELINLISNPQDIALYYPENSTTSTRTVDPIAEGTNEYIIITPERFVQRFQRLRNIYDNKGYTTRIYALEYILENYEGEPLRGMTDDAAKIRQFIIQQYKNNDLQYVLLAGAYPEMPIRYYRGSVPTDLYFSDLNSVWKPYNDYFYPEFLDGYPDVFVGRLPVNNIQQIDSYIDKLLIYEYQHDKDDISYLSKGILTRQDDDMLNVFNDSVLAPFFELFESENLLDLSAYDGRTISGNTTIAEINNSPGVIHNFVGHGNPGGVGIRYNNTYTSYGIVALQSNNSHYIAESTNGLNNLSNVSFPGWSYSMSCTLMPFDKYEEPDIELNFGESYLIGGNYGGVLFLGNTRASRQDDGAIGINRFYKVLLSHKNNKTSYSKGLIGSEILAEGQATFFNSTNETMMKNVLGDPLIVLWCGKPQRVAYNLSTSSTERTFNITNLNEYWLGFNNLEMEGIGKSIEYKSNSNSQSLNVNSLVTVFGKNIISEILPLYLQNYRFTYGTQNSLVVKDLYACYDISPFSTKGNIVFGNDAIVDITALGRVDLDYGTIFEVGTKVTIKAHKEVFLGHLTVPAGAKLHVEAPKITWPEDHVTFNSNADVVLIENGNQVYPKVSKKSIKRQSTSTEPMVVEGRTWWYESDFIPSHNREFGFRIGAPVDIDGVEWYPVYQIRYALKENLISSNGVWIPTQDARWVIDDTPQHICYIRQQDDRVYSRFSWDSWTPLDRGLTTEPLAIFKLGPFSHLLEYCYEPSEHEFSFSVKGDIQTEFEYNCSKEFVLYQHDLGPQKVYYRFDNIEEITNSGFSYEVYDIKYLGHEGKIFGACSCKCIPQFGWFANEDEYTSELFFIPQGIEGYSCSTFNAPPRLQYITDADNNIIFEHNGGLKLWELTESGINDAFTESDTGNTRWYTLDGRHINYPSTSGIYLRQIGAKTEKVIIR